MREQPGRLDAVLDDLATESTELDALVADRSASDWARSTPAAGWTIADQIGHLAWTDDIATTAVIDPGRFATLVGRFAEDAGAMVDAAAHEWAGDPALLDRWRRGRARLAEALRDAGVAGGRIAWFGPPMSATSMATARLMETWAHGQDVADALGVAREPTDRLHHVAHLGVRTRDFAFVARGLPAPAEEFRIELSGPGGDTWAWGPPGAAQSVTGPALDFCLLVTRRRHRDDLALSVHGPDADRWLSIAQAFAGPPGTGRRPGESG